MSRLVLMPFDPRRNMDKLYAVHSDGNVYDHRLRNLRWSPKLIHESSGNRCPVNLQPTHSTASILQFESLKKCEEYFASININISRRSISKLCLNKEYKCGFHFSFQSQDKYRRNKITNKAG
eukprot:238074_1